MKTPSEVRCCERWDGILWLCHRSGQITLRDVTSGEHLQEIKLKDQINITTLLLYNDRMWIASSDGVLRGLTREGIESCRINLNTAIDLRNSIILTTLVVHKSELHVGCDSGVVIVVNVLTEGFKIIERSDSPITSLSSRHETLYAGCSDGTLIAIGNDETLRVKAHREKISSLLWSHISDTLWIACTDGRIIVLDASQKYWKSPLATLTHHQNSQISENSIKLLEVGTTILSCDSTGNVLSWDPSKPRQKHPIESTDTTNRTAANKVVGGCYAFHCRGTQDLISSWVFGRDRNMVSISVPGAAASSNVSYVPKEDLVNSEHAHDKTKIALEQLKERISSMEMRNSAFKNTYSGSNAEKDKAFETISSFREQLQLKECELHIQKKTMEVQVSDLQDQRDTIKKLEKENHDLSEKLHIAEHEIRQKDKSIKSSETKEKTANLQTDKRTKEVTSHVAKIKQLEQRITDKTKSAEMFTKQIADVKNEVLRKDAQLKKSETEKKDLEKDATTLKSQVTRLESQAALLEVNVKNLKQTLLVKTDDLNEMSISRNSYKTKLGKAASDLEAAVQVLQTETMDKQGVADSAVLARNEVQLLRRERDDLLKRVSLDKHSGLDSQDVVNKLKTQLDHMHDALSQERTNNKLLEDQYSIFQFVINSRGELVTSIWSLHDLLKKVKSNLRDADDFIRRTAVQTLKQTDKERGNILFNTLKDAVQVVEDKNAYIVSNYFTEYEKLHFGISSYHYYPDTKRPQVVGDELLSRLRQVTPSKQFRRDGSPSRNYGGSPHRGITSPRRYSASPGR